MSSVQQRWEPFTSTRLPLMARVLVIAAPGQTIALCSLDLLGIASIAVGGWDHFKQRIARAAGDVVAPPDILITCTHTHSAPESLALSDLYQEDRFQQWITDLVLALGKPSTPHVRTWFQRGYSME
jgi:neutral ceramidase